MNPEQSSIACIVASPCPIALETREATPSTWSLWNASPAFASTDLSRPQSPLPLDRIDLNNKSSPTCVADRFFDFDFKARHERGISFPPMTFLSRSFSDYSVESELSQIFDAHPPPQLLRITSQSDVERFARPSDPVSRILLEQFSDADQDSEHLETFSKYHHGVQVDGREDYDSVS
jgi:hypothetical protein